MIPCPQELLNAAAEGDADRVAAWTSHGKFAPEYWMALVRASAAGHEACVRQLLAICSEVSAHWDAAAEGPPCRIERMGSEYLPRRDRLRKFTRALTEAAANGHLACVQTILASASGASANANCRALEMAAKNGHLECAAALLDHCDPRARDCECLVLAARGGAAQCVELLLPYAGIEALGRAAKAAASAGHVECLSALAPFASQNARADALEAAALNGHEKCLAILIRDFSPGVEACNAALGSAAMLNRSACVSVLLPHTDLFTKDDCGWNALCFAGVNSEAARLIHEWLAERERKALESELGCPSRASARQRTL